MGCSGLEGASEVEFIFHGAVSLSQNVKAHCEDVSTLVSVSVFCHF
jgi:hypothetical protein